MASQITLAVLKGELYLDIKNTVTEYDASINRLIDGVIAQALSYLNNEDITEAADFGADIERALCLQINYEWRRRRKEVGLASASYPDGRVDKYEIGEWLESVEKVLERYRHIEL